MNADDLNDLEHRLAEAEQQVRILNSRVTTLERETRGVPITPPPFIAPKPEPKVWKPIPASPPQFDLPTPKPVKQAVNVDDIEYKIGITGLVRGGAVLVILGLLYLVALGITRGWITPQVQFIAEILLCLGFIGVGIWKRAEREEFGQILTGIGSCGLYFSFAGAHVYKHLYEGEILVALFLGLSLLNLGYSLWQTSRAFLVIGLVGGLIGSVLPMKEDRALLTAALHFLILLPSAGILIKNRWHPLTPLLGIASSAALIPVFFSHESWVIRITALFASCVVSAFAYGQTFEQNKWDPKALFLPFMAATTAIGGMLLDHANLQSSSGETNPAHGTWPVLILATLISGVAYLLRDKIVVRDSLLLGAAGIAALLSPIGLDRTPEAFVYLGIAVALGVASGAGKSLTGTWLAWITFSFGLMAYVSPWSSQQFLPTYETGFLVFAMSTAALLAWATSRNGKEAEPAAFVASLLCLPMALRMSYLWVTPPWPNADYAAFMVGFGIFSVVLLALGKMNGWKSLVGVGGLCSVGACLVYAAGAHFSRDVDLAMIGVLGALVLIAGVTATPMASQNTKHAVNGSVAAILAMLVTRLSVVLFAGVVGEPAAFTSGLLFASLVGSGLSLRYRWGGTLVISWVAAVLGAASVFCAAGPLVDSIQLWDLRGQDPGFVLLLCAAGLASVVLAAIATKPFDPDSDTTESCGVLTSFPAWTTLAYVVLTQHVGMKGSAAVTVAWTVFALGLMVVGFWRKLRVVRLWSFAVFALTVGKVILLDLAYLDAGIRVLILLLLGMAMLGGGYWYIRTAKPQGRADSA